LQASKSPTTLGELKKSGWRSKRVMSELRDNLIAALAQANPPANPSPSSPIVD